VWNYTWITITIIGLIVGILFKFTPKKPGNLKVLLEGLHTTGMMSFTHFIPMFFISIISISAGTSTGPEVVVLIMSGCLANVIGTLDKLPVNQRRILTLSWMSAGISAFFGLPLGGALFVLEIPHRMGLQYFEALSPVMIASVLSTMIAKAVYNAPLSGVYDYPQTPKPVMALDMLIGIALGLIGAGLAFIFTFIIKSLKKIFLKTGFVIDKSPIIVLTLGGLLVGWIGVLYPQTLFWSEYEMPILFNKGVGYNETLPHTIVPGALHVGIPYTSVTLAGIGAAKMLAIIVCVSFGFPGGILFPVYYVGFAFGAVIADFLPFVKPTLAMLTVAASFQVAILRTAWATNVILLVLSAPISHAPNDLIGIFPIMTIASYVSLFLTRKYHYYPHTMQRSRDDFHPKPPGRRATMRMSTKESIHISQPLLSEELVSESDRLLP